MTLSMKALTQPRRRDPPARRCATSGTEYDADGSPIGQKGSFSMWRRTPTAVTSPGRVIHQPSDSVSKHHRGTHPRNELACGRNCWVRSDTSPKCYLNGDTTEYVKDTCPNSTTMTKCGLSATDAGVGGRNLNAPWSTRSDGTGRYPGLTLDRSAVASLLQPKPQVRSGNTLRGPNTARDTRQLLQLQGVDYRRGNACVTNGVNSVRPRNVVPIFAAEQHTLNTARFNADGCCFVSSSNSPVGMLRPPARLGAMPAQTLIHEQHANAKRNACADYKWQGTCGGGNGSLDWTDYANVLSGTASSDLFGSSVAISPNGKHMAVGVPQIGSGTGEVNMYQLQNHAWVSTGTISGPVVGGATGYSVDISDDGTRVIIGSPNANANTGFAEVYEYDGVNWNMLGVSLPGVNPGVVAPGSGDYSGLAVAISGDGTRVAVGAPYVVVIAGVSTGGAVTYEWDDNVSVWNTYGAAMIVGPFADSALGYALSLSQDGSQVLVGIPSLANINDTSSTTPGYIQLFELDSGSWSQETVQIGSVAGGAFGFSVSLSDSGNTIAGGAPYATVNSLSSAGYTSVYRKNLSGIWTQQGSDIVGLQSPAQAGVSISLSSSGGRIAVAYPVEDSGQPVNGFGRVFQFRDNTWSQIGSDIENVPTENNSNVRSVALSGAGNLLITGRPLYNSDGNLFSGAVYTYRLESISPAQARCCPAVPVCRPVRC